MKVNSLGIQSYQLPNATKPPTSEKATIDNKPAENVVVTPQPQAQQSSLAIKATPTDYGSLLSEPERRAMEALFARFKDTGRIAGSANPSSEADRGLGKIIDVKV